MTDLKKLKAIASNSTILYVEDDDALRKSVCIYLDKLFAKVHSASDGQEGLLLYEKYPVDIVLTDIRMPIMDGLEMIQNIKTINENQNIIIVSAYSQISNFTKSIQLGVDGYILKPIDYEQMNNLLYKILLKIQKFHENEQYQNNLESLVQSKTQETLELQEDKLNNYRKTLYALVDIIESRDTYTGGHSQRVATYSKRIAQELGFDAQTCDLIYEAGILHDIGKISIPDSILLKPGQLNDIEYTLIQEHVIIGYNMLKNVPMFKEIAQMILGHHERYDGTGYPNGLKAHEISIEAQVMAIADVFDAMTTSRIYKVRKSVSEALEELDNLRNRSFDSKIVDVALKVLSGIELTQEADQLPTTQLESERFSYFYKDQVTGGYNKNYLDLILSKNQYDHQYAQVYVLSLHNFGHYNELYSWEKGDELLNLLTQTLQEKYPGILIFRIHGDDFICLSKTNLDISVNIFEDVAQFDKNIIELNLNHFNIQEHHITHYDALEKLNI
ncbi:MAG: response regulator [Campylobacterota bacterium]|nr:response regulator [Campylobacterota bacterium]